MARRLRSQLGRSRVPQAARGQANVLLLLGLSAVGGIATAAAVAQLNVPTAGAPPQAVVWIAGFVAGFVALLHIIEKLRLLLGHPPVRRSEHNLIQEVAAVNAALGEIRADYAAITQILKSTSDEVDRLRTISEGIDDRISRAMSKVASTATETINNIAARLEERQEKFETRLLALERGRRR